MRPSAMGPLAMRWSARAASEAGQGGKLSRVDAVELYFFGTASASPTFSRNQTSMAMRMCGQSWLFDCGEATQHRMQQTHISPVDISRIFISHMHGDHIFGLPGLLCHMASVGSEAAELSPPRYGRDSPLVVVGPTGIRSWLRAALCNAYARLGDMHVQVHELTGFKAFQKGDYMRPAVYIGEPHPNEVPGLTISPEADGSWLIPAAANDPPMSIRAVELDHTVPTVGYVLEEEERVGRLRAEGVVPLLRQHNIPLETLREFKTGSPIALPDGTTLHPADHMDQPTQRKFAILSDCRGAKGAAEAHCRGATLLVHEATNAYLQGDKKRGGSHRETQRTAMLHGHSTPQMAGRFASRVGAEHLVLTHFSNRYPGDLSRYSQHIMGEIRNLARSEYKGEITTARDLMYLSVGVDGTVQVDGAPTYDDDGQIVRYAQGVEPRAYDPSSVASTLAKPAK